MSKIIKACFVKEKKVQHKPVAAPHECLTKESADEIYYEAKTMLEELVIEAQRKADEIILKAKEEAQDLLKKAELDGLKLKDEAYQAGYERGYEQGLEKSQTDLEARYNALETLITTFRQEKEEYFKEQDKDIVDLVITLAKRIIGSVIDSRPETIKDIIKNTLDQIGDAQKIIIKVNPIHVPYLSKLEESFKDAQAVDFQIIEDDAVSPGNCQVITENGFVDFLIEEQLSKLKQALLEVD